MFNNQLLKELYVNSGMTASKFSEELWGAGANRTISYFNNRTKISTELLTKLCFLFKVSADELLGIPKFSSATDNVVIGDNNNVGNTQQDNSILYLSLLKSSIKTMQETIKSLQSQIEKKDGEILALKKTQEQIVNLAKSDKNRTKK